jgi:hypothetical protein
MLPAEVEPLSEVQTPARPGRRLPLDQWTLDELRRLVREGWVRSLVIRD